MSKDAIETNIINKMFQLTANEQEVGGRYLLKEADIIDGLTHTLIEWLENIEQETIGYDRMIDTFAGNSIRNEIDTVRDEIKSLKNSLCRLHERTT
jgi:hypothetical protein